MYKHRIALGSLHNHTENSLKDSGMSVKKLVETAVALGCPALALTDHGRVSGIDEFVELCEAKGIKPIPGVEAYVQEDNSLDERAHMIIMATDEIGYKAIGCAVSDSYARMDEHSIPRMNWEIINKWFGPKSEAYGHVILTTACMSGIIGSVITRNDTIKNKMQKEAEKAKKYISPKDPAYVMNQEKYAELMKLLDSLKSEKDALTPIAKRVYGVKLRSANALLKKGDEIGYNFAMAKIAEEQEETERAKARLDEIKSEMSKLKSKATLIKSQITEAQKSVDKWNAINETFKKLSEGLIPDENLYDEAKARALKLADIVGHENLYVELQNHGIPAEKKVYTSAARIAKELGLKVVAANDAHIPTNSEEDILQRQIMRSLRFNKYDEGFVGDDQLYIKTDDELAAALMEILPREVVDEAMTNVGEVADKTHFKFNKKSHYPVFHSDIPGETSPEALKRLVSVGKQWRFPDGEGWSDTYQQRLDYELDVIIRMGYADYHLIVQDFLNVGRKIGQLDKEHYDYLKQNVGDMDLQEMLDYLNTNATDVGVAIGPGRGSAAGSLVCYLLGITNIDPIKLDLLFERFLNVERVSMPDIDSDIATYARDLVIEYVKKRYGKHATCCIMTRSKQVAKGSVRNCARILGSKKYDDNKHYLALADQIAKAIPADCKSLAQKIDPDDVDSQTYTELLNEKFADNDAALEIIKWASIVENTIVTDGVHAAGVIISDTPEVKENVPLLFNKKKNVWCTQCDMIQAEAKGMLKMDFLGLTTLDIITSCLKMIKKNHGVLLRLEDIPLDPVVFKKIYSTGMTNSVFQFESGGMKKMLKQFKPDSIDDVILLNAAYRPGPMQYLDNIIAVKHGKTPLKYLTPELEPILRSTYGAIIYQEQVQQIFQKLAGFSLGQADLVRRAMSKKKLEKLMHERAAFINGDPERNIVGCVTNGISEDVANELFDQMTDFAQYAFNKSHAAAYSYVSYYTAWLKYYYPAEFLCANMDFESLDKIPGLIEDAHQFGISVLSPSVNDSEEGFCVKDGNIVFGLSSIKNVGNSASLVINERRENGAYISLKNYLQRTSCNRGTTTSLISAGAMDMFSGNRFAMNSIVEECNEVLKKIAKKNEQIEETADEKKLEKYTKARQELVETYASIHIEDTPEDRRHRLLTEKELLGVYVSGHPLDSYKDITKYGCTRIEDLVNGKSTIGGIVCDLRIVKKKADGKNLAFFTLEDKTGKIEVCCFTKAYEKFGMYIQENAVISIKGKCYEEAAFNSDDDDEESTVKKFSVESIDDIPEDLTAYLFHVNSVVDWQENYLPIASKYRVAHGHRLTIHDRAMNEYRKCPFEVSDEIMDEIPCKIDDAV